MESQHLDLCYLFSWHSIIEEEAFVSCPGRLGRLTGRITDLVWSLLLVLCPMANETVKALQVRRDTADYF